MYLWQELYSLQLSHFVWCDSLNDILLGRSVIADPARSAPWEVPWGVALSYGGVAVRAGSDVGDTQTDAQRHDSRVEVLSIVYTVEHYLGVHGGDMDGLASIIML